METKCPVCGAPIKEKQCGYCGYTAKEKAEEKQTADMDFIRKNTESVQPVNTDFIRNNTEPVQPVINTNPIFCNVGVENAVSPKSKTAALLLCIFLGGFGIHRFYAGKIGTGILYLFTAGLFGFGWLIDIILIAVGSFKDKHGLRICR